MCIHSGLTRTKIRSRCSKIRKYAFSTQYGKIGTLSYGVKVSYELNTVILLFRPDGVPM